jgi:hypothetical protein
VPRVSFRGSQKVASDDAGHLSITMCRSGRTKKDLEAGTAWAREIIAACDCSGENRYEDGMQAMVRAVDALRHARRLAST